jgi:3-phosphoshikimate 1-carboxyvinyltransferase
MLRGRRVAFLPFFEEAALSARASAKLVAQPVACLKGRVRAPGDKSVSHRALMFGALALGETTVRGLLEGEDVLCTAAALRALGAEVVHEPGHQSGPESGGSTWRIRGFGVGGGREPADVLDLGNSGTAARLLSGILASQPFTSFMTGDASLRGRPMQRVIEPLSRMGARFEARDGGRMPLAIIGTDEMVPIEYRLPVASAQVKSAILLAGLNTAGETTVIEPHATRDHTERMLRHFGAEVRVTAAEGGGKRITVVGWPELLGRDIIVPGDPSSAAFAVVAAAIRPGSDITVENVGLNPLRAGLYQTLLDMGADIAFENEREVGGEPVADLHVKGSALKGVEVPAERAPTMIDEYPILAVAAACARGTTRMLGLAELRAKESDRLASVSAGLLANGVKHEMGADTLVVHGTGAAPAGGGLVATHLDHRIAMSFLVLGLAAREPVAVDDGAPIDTSFPGFAKLMNGLGAHIGPDVEAA